MTSFAAASPAQAPERAADVLPSLVARLEEEIVLGQARPGQRLIEDELILRLGAKRHVVRQVLVELERIGLIDRIPNRGAVVKSWSRAEVEHLYAVRALVETEAARTMPLPGAPGLVAALTQVQAEHDAAVSEGDSIRAFHANQAFHRALFGASGNPVLAATIEDLARQAHGVRFHSLSDPRGLERARREHWRIIKAIEAGDRKTLVGLCAAHLPPSQTAYLKAQRSA